MSDFHTFDVFLPLAAVGGRVTLDGQELRGVTEVLVRGRVGELTEVIIHLHPKIVTVHGESERLKLVPAMADITGLDETARRYGPVALIGPGTVVSVPGGPA